MGILKSGEMLRKIVFVDFDGTLHDSDRKYAQKLEGLIPGFEGEKLWRAYLSFHREKIHRFHPEKHDDIPFQIEMLLRELEVEIHPEKISEIVRRFKEAQEECWEDPELFPDAIPFLRELRRRGYRIWLSTGEHGREKAEGVERAAGEKFFEKAFDRELGGMKGDPEFFRRALLLSGSFPQDAVSLGDSPYHDIAPASSLGIRTIWLNREGKAYPPDLPKPDFEVRNLLEALSFLPDLKL